MGGSNILTSTRNNWTKHVVGYFKTQLIHSRIVCVFLSPFQVPAPSKGSSLLGVLPIAWEMTECQQLTDECSWTCLHGLHCSWHVCCVFPPTAGSCGVSAQIGSRVVRGGPEVRFHEGSSRVPPGLHHGSTRVPRGAARAAGWCEHKNEHRCC